jgi:hypothetical protein
MRAKALMKGGVIMGRMAVIIKRDFGGKSARVIP